MNIKGVFQIWMQRRRLPRDQPQGVPRLDPRGLHPLPRLRRRARRHLHRRHRQGQRLDPHRRPHRPRPRGHPAHDRRRVDHRPPGRRGPRRHRPDAQAVRRRAASAGPSFAVDAPRSPSTKAKAKATALAGSAVGWPSLLVLRPAPTWTSSAAAAGRARRRCSRGSPPARRPATGRARRAGDGRGARAPRRRTAH